MAENRLVQKDKYLSIPLPFISVSTFCPGQKDSLVSFRKYSSPWRSSTVTVT